MNIDWSIRAGDVISFAGFAGAGLGFLFTIRSEIKLLAQRMGFLEKTTEEQNEKIDKQSEEIGKFGELLTLMGRYEERMGYMRRDIDDLKHGRGYIINPPA